MNVSTNYTYACAGIGIALLAPLVSQTVRDKISDLSSKIFSYFSDSLDVRWNSRPRYMQKLIDRNFADRARNMEGSYSKVGAADYQYPALFYGLSESAKRVEKRAASQWIRASGERPLQVLDLGTGSGQFLLDMERRFSNTELQGIAVVRSDRAFRPGQFLTGNIENLDKMRGLGKYDRIFSAFTFMHLCDPLGAVCRAYELLEPGGELIIDHFGIPGLSVQEFKTHLKRYGYEFECIGEDSSIDMLILKKTKYHLRLPIKYDLLRCYPGTSWKKAEIRYRSA